MAFAILFLIFGFISIAGTLLWVWMLVEAITKEPSEGNDKLVWVIVILLTHWLGALIYYIVRRPVRLRELGG